MIFGTAFTEVLSSSSSSDSYPDRRSGNVSVLLSSRGSDGFGTVIGEYVRLALAADVG